MTYPLWGLVPPGGNRLSEGEYHDSLIALQALENTRTIWWSLAGQETDGTPAAPGSGHSHDTADTALPWMQVGASHIVTAIPSNTPGFRRVDETSDTPIAFFAFILPDGFDDVVVRVRAFLSDGFAVQLDVRLRFFEPSDLVTEVVDYGYLTESVPGGSDFDGWMESSNIDLSGIGNTDDRRIVYCLVEAKVDANYADIFEVAIDPVDASSAPASVALDEALALAHVDLSPDDLATLFITNPSRLRDLIYGTTFPLPRHSRPHDHGEGRGETLTDRAILMVTYGPHAPEGGGATAGGGIGIPILEPDTGVDFAATPKVIAQHGLFVPGQVESVKFRAVLYEEGGDMEDITLLVEVRPLSDVGYGPGENLGVTGQISFEGTGDDRAEATVTLDLSPLGDIHRDRVFDLTLWQADNPSPGTDHRLTSLLAYAGDAPATLPELATHAPREELAYSKILEGQEVSTLLAAKIHRALNQVTYEALGGVPGLEPDLATTDTTDPWLRQLSEVHQHRGTYDDGGNRVDDGAVIRLPLLAASFAANVAGGSPENSVGDADPVRGIKLHTTGSILTAGWLSVQGRAVIPQGLGAFDLYALIQPGTSLEISRLIAFVQVLPITGATTLGSSILTGVRSGPFSASPTFAGSSVACQVLPVDSIGWQQNARRISNGLGVWTNDAKRPSSDLPATVNLANLGRWTQPIRVEIAPTGTDPCLISVRFGLQTGVQTAIQVAGTYDSAARLLAVLAVPAAGY